MTVHGGVWRSAPGPFAAVLVAAVCMTLAGCPAALPPVQVLDAASDHGAVVAADAADATVSRDIPSGSDTGLAPTDALVGTDVVVVATDLPVAADVRDAAMAADIMDVSTGTDAGVTSAVQSCPVAAETGCGTVRLPGGTFTMGGDETSGVNDNPAQTSIFVSAFTLDAYEVTVARFRRFWVAGHPAPGTDPVVYPGGTSAWGGPVTVPVSGDVCTWSASAASLEAHPINCVDWFTAQAFCVWDGGRLPTEAEWEFAARAWAVDSLAPGRNYPWGSSDPSTSCDLAQWNTCVAIDGTVAESDPVGHFAPSGGLYDLAGNVAEWTADWYQDFSDPTCWSETARSNPICNNSSMSDGRSIRGGSWSDTTTAALHSAARHYYAPTNQHGVVGFRCAR